MKDRFDRKITRTVALIFSAMLTVSASGCSEGVQSETAPHDSSVPETTTTETAPEPTAEESTAATTGAAAAAPTVISLAEAKKAVLDHAGLTEAQVTFLKAELDNDDGALEYDISFLADSVKYEYEISAEDGLLLEFSSNMIQSETTPQAETTAVQSSSAVSQTAASTEPTSSQTTAAASTTTAVSTTAAKSENITEAKARQIALKDAGLKESQVTFTKSKQDYDDGVSKYEIEFVTDSKKYEYEIRVSDGAILESSAENISTPAQQQTAGNIDETKAKQIALKDAGLKESQVTFTKSKQDYDDGVSKYEIEFVTDSKKYEYEIRVSDGAILESSAESISTPAQQQTAGNIDEERAKQIALDYAGFTSSQVKFTQAKLDRDDGVTVYEIEFRANGREYELKIDASTGKVLEMDIDD